MIKKQHGSDLFIVDNSDELWKVLATNGDWPYDRGYSDY